LRPHCSLTASSVATHAADSSFYEVQCRHTHASRLFVVIS